jgi:predicted Zn-dependent protease
MRKTRPDDLTKNKIKRYIHMKKHTPLIFLVLIFMISCSVVPMTGRKQFVAIPSSQMISLSAESYSKVLAEGKLSTNTDYVNMIRRVGQRLTAAVETYMKQNKLEAAMEGYDWQYNVLVSEDLNAWCMPGGQIAFYEGIMPVCKDEAGVG